MDNVSEHVDITELEVKLKKKKIDKLQRKIEELKELLFGLKTAKPTEEAEFEEDVYKCETRLDDLEDTREEALFISRHAKNIMKEAGMEMRKWISNDTVLMAQWAAEGFLWMHPSGTLDKKITWNEILSPKLKEKWLIWCKELPLLDHLRIPRLVLDSTNDEVSDLIEIHIFCDASKLAYGAAAYVKVRKQNEVLVNLITSKTRVAPLKAVTLPRLELLGALVAARLSSRVQEIIRKKKECKVFHWTDSKIVLFWIKGSSKRWKQFVANRVQEISKLTDPDSWFHCSDKTTSQISCLGTEC
ncbi:uncharacterized protein TNCV_4194551 [Trichonephila clavipes]|nr:uncharacterized protein TNCV_4194551 [Trichonephila clavipes]